MFTVPSRLASPGKFSKIIAGLLKPGGIRGGLAQRSNAWKCDVLAPDGVSGAFAGSQGCRVGCFCAGPSVEVELEPAVNLIPVGPIIRPIRPWHAQF